MTLKEAFFEDLTRHLELWRDDLVKAIADPATSNWAESRQAFERLHRKNFSAGELEDLREVLDECFRGILHSTLVTIDGGTVLGKVGTVSLVDRETKNELTAGSLHEEFIEYLVGRGLA